MADSNFRGPVNAMGATEIQSGTTGAPGVLDGPSMFYQGVGIIDPRSTFSKDGFRPGQQPAFLNAGDIVSLDGIPQAAASNTLAAATVITATVAMNLATVAVTNFSSGAMSIAVGVPIIPQGTTAVTIANIALDFGFTTGTTVANSTAVQVADNSLFSASQWIVIGNVGNSAGTRSLVTQVTAISTTNSTTINVLNAPATALGVPIGQANLYGSDYIAQGTVFGPQTASASAHSLGARISGGLGRFMNPAEMLARAISVQADASTAGTATILVSGWDVWGSPMTELLTASGTTPIYGKKAWKYIQSAVPQTIGTTVSANYTLGISDVFGLPFRVDRIEGLNVWAGGTATSNTVGITTAVLTGATNTSGDVRGTIQLSALGGGTPISAAATSNNVKRLYVVETLTAYQTLFANPVRLAPMFGTTQV